MYKRQVDSKGVFIEFRANWRFREYNGFLVSHYLYEMCIRDRSKDDKDGAVKVTKGFAYALAGKAYLFAGQYDKMCIRDS